MCPTVREIDRLTVRRNLTSVSAESVVGRSSRPNVVVGRAPDKTTLGKARKLPLARRGSCTLIPTESRVVMAVVR